MRVLVGATMVVAMLVGGCGGVEVAPVDNGGGYFEPCRADGSCNPGLTCMNGAVGSNWRGCVWPVEPSSCGHDGEPCCVTRNEDGTIAAPCRGVGQCEQWCNNGLRCDGSHRTGDRNVCTSQL